MSYVDKSQIVCGWKMVLSVCSLLAGPGCMSEIIPDVGAPVAGQCKNEDHEPDVEVSFKEDILPLMGSRCSCHDPHSPSPVAIDSTGFSVGNYSTIRRGGQKSGAAIVVDKDACGSLLVQKCSEAPPSGTRMPMYGPYFTAHEMALLEDWIIEGAREN